MGTATLSPGQEMLPCCCGTGVDGIILLATISIMVGKLVHVPYLYWQLHFIVFPTNSFDLFLITKPQVLQQNMFTLGVFDLHIVALALIYYCD